MKAEDLRAKTLDELKKELLELKKKQLNLRFQLAQGQLANTAEIRVARRNVARVKTLIHQKTTEAAAGTKPEAAKKKSGKKAA